MFFLFSSIPETLSTLNILDLLISGKFSGKITIGILTQLCDAMFDKENYFSGNYEEI